MANWQERLKQKAEEVKKEQLRNEKAMSEGKIRLDDYLKKLHARDLLEGVKMEAWGVGEIRKLERPDGIEIAWELYYKYQDAEEIINVLPPTGAFSAPEVVHTGRFDIVTRLASITIGIMVGRDIEGRTDLYFVHKPRKRIAERRDFPYSYGDWTKRHISNHYHSIGIDVVVDDPEIHPKKFLETNILTSIAPLPLSLEAEGKNRIEKLVRKM